MHKLSDKDRVSPAGVLSVAKSPWGFLKYADVCRDVSLPLLCLHKLYFIRYIVGCCAMRVRLVL